MSIQLTLEVKAKLDEFNLRKTVYEKAKAQIHETMERVQLDLHDAHPLQSLVRAERDLDLLISGCSSRIKRIETLGR